MPSIYDYLKGGALLLGGILVSSLITYPIAMAMLSAFFNSTGTIYNIAYVFILLGHIIVVFLLFYVGTWGVPPEMDKMLGKIQRS